MLSARLAGRCAAQRDVGFDPAGLEVEQEVACVVAGVGDKCARPDAVRIGDAVEHHERALALGLAVGLGEVDVDQQVCARVDEDVQRVRENGGLAVSAACKAGFGIGDRAVRVVAALGAAEVGPAVAVALGARTRGLDVLIRDTDVAACVVALSSPRCSRESVAPPDSGVIGLKLLSDAADCSSVPSTLKSSQPSRPCSFNNTTTSSKNARTRPCARKRS